jgi:hypothetical protein
MLSAYSEAASIKGVSTACLEFSRKLKEARILVLNEDRNVLGAANQSTSSSEPRLERVQKQRGIQSADVWLSFASLRQRFCRPRTMIVSPA